MAVDIVIVAPTRAGREWERDDADSIRSDAEDDQ